MRLLVACDHCHRQYDAGTLAAGSRFHCRCGATVTVPRADAREAPVVRCSSCGGARAGGATACPYCGSSFTTHERDMDTICPECMARLSNRAKYCHHCGTAIVPEEAAGESTDLPCPCCGRERNLTSRRLGSSEVAVLECARCGGLWLGQESLRRVLERARKIAASDDGPAAGKPAPGRPRRNGQRGPMYRPCPRCGAMMHRTNYAKRSGVIIDSCKEHGLWFDADELDAIVRWIRAGGEARAERLRAEEAAQAQRDAIFRPRWEKMTPGGGRLDTDGSDLGLLLTGLFDF